MNSDFESRRRVQPLVWVSVALLAVGWVLMIAASIAGNGINWWNWFTLLAGTGVVAVNFSASKDPKRLQLLILAAGVFAVAGVVGQIWSLLR